VVALGAHGQASKLARPGVSAPVTGSGIPPIGAVGCRQDKMSIGRLCEGHVTNSGVLYRQLVTLLRAKCCSAQ